MERDSFIELAGEADLPDIARIHIASWQDAYRGVLPSEILASRSREGSLRGWQSTLKKFPGNLTVARAQDGAILGFCCAGPDVNEARSGPFGFEIYGLHVEPQRRRRGIGGRLLREALLRAKDRTIDRTAIVWTLRDLSLSRQFYEREGGVLVKTGTWAFEGRGFPEVAYGWDFENRA
jgi:ribosomal protein S18 acetylase RimI-like enzyme